MGTRHLIAIIQNGKHVLAQYGQWDGYPEGQGEKIVSFLRGVDLDAFKAKVAACDPWDGERITATRLAAFAELGVTPDKHGLVPDDAARKVDQALPAFSRDTGSKILNLIMEAQPGMPIANNSWEFGNDSLFCEWAYVLDLDRDKLEVYRGFQKDPHDKGRWAGNPPNRAYYPIALAATFDISSIPDNWAYLVEPGEEESVDAQTTGAGEA